MVKIRVEDNITNFNNFNSFNNFDTSNSYNERIHLEKDAIFQNVEKGKLLEYEVMKMDKKLRCLFIYSFTDYANDREDFMN